MRLYRPKSDYIKYLSEIDRTIINSKNVIGVSLNCLCCYKN
ncbi:hypothetical protein NE542_14080 [Faecalibacillus intestinalis]|uniref:Uncharacterized protein n=1 Tax=Faecalibacillus intestinalis TaxID=1982626 RepID=A0AAP2UI01_9FIRM|nr:hypothetical protein [Faecalibacillus intestinalis]MCQ5062945.1 hypothetical protein [Faecalibacillus intestinalis]